MDKSFRIIFQGRLQPGRDPAQVRSLCALRLKISSEQVHKIFSGARVILKQGLSAEQALAYQRSLEQLGLQIMVEETPGTASAAPAGRADFDRTQLNLARAEALLTAAPASPPAVAPTPRKKPAFLEGWLHESGFDRLERTQQRLADAEALLQRPALQAAANPAQSARQLAQSPASAEPASKHVQHSSHFICSHCGTPHEISIQPSNHKRRESA